VIFVFENNVVEVSDVSLSIDSQYAEQVQSLLNNIIVLCAMNEKFNVYHIFEDKTHTLYYGIKISKKNDVRFSTDVFHCMLFTRTHVTKNGKIVKIKDRRFDGCHFSFTETFRKSHDIPTNSSDWNEFAGHYYFNTDEWKRVVGILEKVQDML
jgi:hypothetical protein